jgi:putative NADH-flavin reductase
MNIVVFGATGGTGQEVVKQALAQGHEVTAFVRDQERLSVQHESLRVVVGDAREPEPVSRAVAGHDAVVVALGTRDRSERTLRADGTANVTRAMETHDIQRLVVVSAGGVGDSYQQVPLIIKMLIKTVLRHTYADHARQEEHVRESDLDWMIVRPAMLTDGPRTGQYHVGAADADLPGGRVTRADVADFILKQLSDDRYLRQAVSIG